jgi:O-methyltransferase domain
VPETRVIHDWDDERAVTVLRQCRAAMAPGATLLLMDHVLPERWAADASAAPPALLDLHMLVMTPGGRERTVSEFRRLLAESGFELRCVDPDRVTLQHDGPFSIVEGGPK